MARSLSLSDDMAFQRRSWFVQRAGWIVMLVLLGLAAAGVFSKGPFSRATATAPSGAITVRYERFLRLGATSTIYIDVRVAERETEVVANLDFIDTLAVESIHPVPSRSSAEPDGTHMVFDTANGGGRIVMSVRPNAVGFSDARISLAEADGVSIPLLVFP